MINLIPPQYRMLAMILSMLVAMALAAAGGAVVNGWRLDAAHQKALTQKQAEYDALAAQVREQNRAIEAAGAEARAADSRRALAEQYAGAVMKRLGSRDERLAGSKATDCRALLEEQWGAWK